MMRNENVTKSSVHILLANWKETNDSIVIGRTAQPQRDVLQVNRSVQIGNTKNCMMPLKKLTQAYVLSRK